MPNLNDCHKLMNFDELVKLNERMKHDGKTIATLFNNSCEMGLEVQYVGDSMWEFVNPHDAELTLHTILEKDAKRCGLDT